MAAVKLRRREYARKRSNRRRWRKRNPLDRVLKAIYGDAFLVDFVGMQRDLDAIFAGNAPGEACATTWDTGRPMVSDSGNRPEVPGELRARVTGAAAFFDIALRPGVAFSRAGYMPKPSNGRRRFAYRGGAVVEITGE